MSMLPSSMSVVQRWGRYEEVYGESPYLVAELGIEMVRGMQHNHQVAATGNISLLTVTTRVPAKVWHV